ncbi:MAG: type II toxin-antitoxin system Phd/YefM family antitoxin [Candidatus Latescibacteria bacterium]|nr:type II toxin-antitoxin system Phd/YefM family antitoxin [Candidatus Latescibacterota bacterium]
MKTITFTEFRRNAAACLSDVEKGEKIRVLRHGRPIADIIPVSDGEQVVSWKRPALRLSVEGVSLSQEVLKDRERARS